MTKINAGMKKIYEAYLDESGVPHSFWNTFEQFHDMLQGTVRRIRAEELLGDMKKIIYDNPVETLQGFEYLQRNNKNFEQEYFPHNLKDKKGEFAKLGFSLRHPGLDKPHLDSYFNKWNVLIDSRAMNGDFVKHNIAPLKEYSDYLDYPEEAYELFGKRIETTITSAKNYILEKNPLEYIWIHRSTHCHREIDFGKHARALFGEPFLLDEEVTYFSENYEALTTHITQLGKKFYYWTPLATGAFLTGTDSFEKLIELDEESLNLAMTFSEILKIPFTPEERLFGEAFSTVLNDGRVKEWAEHGIQMVRKNLVGGHNFTRKLLPGADFSS